MTESPSWAELVSFSDTIAQYLSPIAHNGDDVCRMCRSGRLNTEALCGACVRRTDEIDLLCMHIIPISYYVTPSTLRDWMHDFKNHTDGAVRDRAGKSVAAIFVRYLLEHRAALQTTLGDWHDIVAVPSSHAPGSSPLVDAINTFAPQLVDIQVAPLVDGAKIDRRASTHRFVATQEGSGRRVLLVDDTYTTGATVQSAAHTLRVAGFEVIAIICVARKINPDPQWGTDQLWARQNNVAFSFTASPWWQRS
jgi:predicted amidophosphoribosyltransferase